jgi:hypothetical protein
MKPSLTDKACNQLEAMMNIPSLLAKPLMRRPTNFLLQLCQLHKINPDEVSRRLENGHEFKKKMVKALIKLPLEKLKLPNENGEYFHSDGTRIINNRWRRP